MARSTADLLDQLEHFLPPEYEPMRPHLAGLAAQMREAELAGDTLEAQTKIGQAVGAFLTLIGRGYGLDRTSEETDDQFRNRIRVLEDRLTKPAIEAAVNELLAAYTTDVCEVVEHWEGGAFVDQAYLDQDYLYSAHNAFTVIAPLIGDFPAGEDYVDQSYVDQAYVGMGGADHPVYPAIIARVEQLRAGGVRWWLVVHMP